MLAAYRHCSSVMHKKNSIFLSTIQVITGSFFLALCAQISLPLYFSPVPISAQTFGVMLIGALMGSRKGLLSVLTYCAQGSMGLPFFAGASFGIWTLFGPTGGYFLGFAFQAYISGWILEQQWHSEWQKISGTLALSSLIQMSCGVLWLSYFVGLPAAITMGFYPFVSGEIIKVVALTLFLKKIS